jgi:hypothetical protein
MRKWAQKRENPIEWRALLTGNRSPGSSDFGMDFAALPRSSSLRQIAYDPLPPSGCGRGPFTRTSHGRLPASSE